MATVDDLESLFTGTPEVRAQAFKDNDPEIVTSNRINYIRHDAKMYKPPLNTTQQVRFITIPGSGYFALPVKVHFSVGTEFHSLPCLVMQGKSCPLCVESQRQYAKGNKDLGKHFKAGIYSLAYIIDRANQQDGPKVFAISGKNTLEAIRNLLKHPITGAVRPFDHPTEGIDLFFSKKEDGSKIGTRALAPLGSFQLNPEGPSPLHPDKNTRLKWFKFVIDNPLDKLLNYVSAEKMIELAGLSAEGEYVGVEAGDDYDSEVAETATKSIDVTPEYESDESELDQLSAEIAAMEAEEAAAAVTPVEEKVLTKTVPAAPATTVSSLRDRIAAKTKKSV